jgi:protein gp37
MPGSPPMSAPPRACELAASGSKAKCFASYMRIHTLEATGGKTYSQMPRYAGKDGKGTNDAKVAVTDPKTGQPVDNPARNIWINEMALSTALNTSYFAEQVSVFSIVMGFALLLTGIGFLVLTVRMLRPAEETDAAEAPVAGAVPAAG